MALSTVATLLPLVRHLPPVKRLLGKAKTGAEETSVGLAILDIVRDVTGYQNPSEDIVREKEVEISQQIHNQEFELELALLSDRQDARQMYSESKKQVDAIAQTVIRWNVVWVVGLVLVQILVVYFLREFGTLIAIVGNVVGFVVAQLLSERGDVIGFYFGSSEGSKEKDRFKIDGK